MARDTSGELDEELSISRVGAWKNKDEFTLVYNWLFSTQSDQESKQKALDRIKIWKIRRLNLTPASVLSTLAILEVQLKDNADEKFSKDELRTMYSNAFTRFLNYMSSIMRSRTLQSMYLTARELGIESFLVDLRHLCAHGQVLPSLEISRRTATYCLNWLREFYWDREKNVIGDAIVNDVHLKTSVELENLASEWFTLYDAATEAIVMGYKNVDDLINGVQNEQLDETAIGILHEYSEKIRHNKLAFIANKAINNLAQLSNSNDSDRGNSNIYCDVLFDCPFFLKRSAKYSNATNKDEQMKFVGIHQNLFRLFAICDFINAIFNRLLLICEDDLEADSRRRAASFWANEIATGFAVFKEFKTFYKAKKEKSSKFDIDMAPINTDTMTDDIKQIYKKLGVNFRGTLIFGDTVRRPWSLHFDRNVLMERALNLNQYTIEVIKKCIYLTEPALQKTQIQYLEKLISIYLDDDASATNQNRSNDDKVYTLLDDVDANNENTLRIESTTSIWREAPDGLNWKSCPFGSMP